LTNAAATAVRSLLLRQHVRRGHARRFGSRRDHRLRANCSRDLLRERVRATQMAGEQADRKAARLVNHDDGRIALLIAQQRRDQPHGDAGRHDQDHPVRAGKLRRDRLGRAVVRRVAVLSEATRHNRSAAWQCLAQRPGQRRAPPRHRNCRQPRACVHASPNPRPLP
jgi:hypothetical protein